MARLPTCVIGGGPAGLATSQQLAARRIPHLVLERGDVVGYTWAHLYESLRLHTGKHMSSLPGLAFPRSAPLFVPRALFWEYLRDYAQRVGLPIETGCQVSGARYQGGVWRQHGRGHEFAGGAPRPRTPARGAL